MGLSQEICFNCNLSQEQKVDLYFSRIQERQILEEEYYNTWNKVLFVEIEHGGEWIRGMERKLGFKLPPT